MRLRRTDRLVKADGALEATAPSIELVLPLEYTAFCLLHQER